MNINVNVHKKAYDEGRKSAPKVFNPNFSKHMEKIEKREVDMRRAKQREGKITMY
jgi:hypothetical protein